MKKSFRGGIRLHEHKNTAACAVRDLPAPEKVYIPLVQHIGAPCTPTVTVGERVLRGQAIGRVENGLGCPVHSSVSGLVREFRSRETTAGTRVTEVTVENDGLMEEVPSILKTARDTSGLTPADIINFVREAGVSGMGGASFPTYAKIASATGKVDTLLINCAECEPYITADHRLLLEDGESVLRGACLLIRAVGLMRGTLVIEDNKPDAIAHLQELIAESYPMLGLLCVRTKYPQGDERQLIYAATKRELPAGKLPADIGCVVFNAETAAAVFRACAYSMPLVERIVTVDGDCVKSPANLRAAIGTPFRYLIEACGGLIKEPARLVSGGPMMGFARWDPDGPVTKGTSAILVLSKENTPQINGEAECIRCGRCVAACPMRLMPNYMAAYARRADYENAADYGALSCVECGACSYVCPARIPLVQHIRVAKAALRRKKS